MNRPTLSGRAPLRPYSMFARACYSADQEQQGGGGDDKGQSDKGGDADKVTLTKAELQQQIADALKAEREAAAEEKRKAQEEADRKKAEDEGKYQEIADQEKAARTAAESEAANLRRDIAIRDAIAADESGIPASCAKYITPLVDASKKGEDLAKAAKAAVEQYAKDNPRQPVKRAGAPDVKPNRSTAGNLPTNQERHVRRFSSLTRRV